MKIVDMIIFVVPYGRVDGWIQKKSRMDVVVV